MKPGQAVASDTLFDLPNTAVPDARLSDDRMYRYQLIRPLTGAPGPICVFAMLNPSTADENDDDPTVRRCKRFALRLRAARLIIVNLYATARPTHASSGKSRTPSARTTTTGCALPRPKLTTQTATSSPLGVPTPGPTGSEPPPRCYPAGAHLLPGDHAGRRTPASAISAQRCTAADVAGTKSNAWRYRRDLTSLGRGTRPDGTSCRSVGSARHSRADR